MNNLHSTGSRDITDSSLNLQSWLCEPIKQLMENANEKAKSLSALLAMTITNTA